MDKEPSLQSRVEALERQLIAVSERVDLLVQSFSMRQDVQEAPVLPGEYATAGSGAALDARGTTLLSSLAIASFLLALALVLRTIVDNGTVNREIGTAFGIAYGGLLLGYGHFSQHRVRRLPLYAICGGVLVFLVVLETCIRFQSLSTATAYTILSLTLCFMTLLGIGHAAPSVIGVGVVGATLAGMAIDFPRWQFPMLWIILALANLAAFRAARVPRWRWLLWPVLLLTLFFWFGWTLQLRAAGGLDTSATWYLPLLMATFFGYAFMSVLAASSQRRTFGYFEACLPLVAGVGAFLCVEAAAEQLGLPPAGIELAAFALGAVSAVAAPLFHRIRHNPRTNAAFSIAGTVLIIFALTSWIENTFALLAILAAIALAAGIAAHPLEATPLRLLATAAQLAVFGAALLKLVWFKPAPPPTAAATLSAVLAVFMLLHYAWARAHPPATTAGFYKWIDRNDYSSAILLLLAVASAFLAAREVLDQTLAAAGILSGNVSYCGQSVLLNIGAAALAFWGLHRKSAEIVLISAGVAAAAALKIFAFDLFHCQGLPLVIDVASFALTAALGSLLWNRWIKRGQ